jgi:hypothetical protein
MFVRIAVFGAAIAISPLAALAQSKAPQGHSYRCVTSDGKKYYGSTIPEQCVGRPVEVISSSGTVLQRIDAEADKKSRAAKEAEAARKLEVDNASREEARRNRALLATYTSEKDIEEARNRALAENAKLVKEVEARIDTIRKRQAGYAKEMEFYSDGGAKAADKGKAKPAAAPKSGAKPPPKLVEDIRMAEVDLKLQEEAADQLKKQVTIINAKYDDDRKRFLALTKR